MGMEDVRYRMEGKMVSRLFDCREGAGRDEYFEEETEVIGNIYQHPELLEGEK